ncbi:MAG TPA: hypothetical protein VGE08_00925 [Steroidobacter sp.]|uniref:hypothetical protein n=1 Tax=Steroidobacter sp. TaxID=1978227 RepID=UPI002ED8B080
MTRIFPAVSLLASLACLSVAALAQDDPQKFSSANVTKTSATVESVDQDARSLVLRNSEGDRTLLVVGPEVRNFEQIEPGDRVSATYREAILAEVLPKGSESSEPRASVAKSRAAPGERPAAAVGATVSTDVVIESVDQSFDTVTFKRPDGIVRTVAVEDPKASQFIHNLNPGDEVRVTYTEATAIAVTPEQ